jgi:Ca2+/H+ antiporter
LDSVWLGLGLLGIGLCVAVVATALTGTVGTVLSALALPAMLAGVMLLDSARHRR